MKLYGMLWRKENVEVRYFNKIYCWLTKLILIILVSYVLEEPTSGGTGTVNIQTRTPRARLEACFLKYQEGLSRVFSTTKPKLWSLYIDFLLDLQKETASVATVLKMETLKAALNDASSDNSLSERHYMAWMEIASEDVLEIAEKGKKKRNYQFVSLQMTNFCCRYSCNSRFCGVMESPNAFANYTK